MDAKSVLWNCWEIGMQLLLPNSKALQKNVICWLAWSKKEKDSNMKWYLGNFHKYWIAKLTDICLTDLRSEELFIL